MANYEASSRSNYFKIRPEMEEEFRTFCEEIGWELDGPDTREGKEGMYCLLKHDSGIPNFRWVENEDESSDEIEVLYSDYARFLAEDSILHITESGYEKLRYLAGYSVWILPNGKYYEVNIHTPPPWVKNYAKKKEIEITACAY